MNYWDVLQLLLWWQALQCCTMIAALAIYGWFKNA